MDSFLRFSASVVLVAILAYATRVVSSRLRYERAVRDNGCAKPCKYRHKDPFLGLDLFMEIAKAFGNGTFLETNRRHFDLHGKTFEANTWGSRTIKSTQPEISEAVYATFFKNFSMEPLRLDVGGPFFGKGILTTDGAFWEHARALIRPTFSRARFANFTSLAVHVDRLIDLIPADGSTFDLQPLFRRLVPSAAPLETFFH
ncbi:MAG: hypothetical protein Q9222_000713 [Ikaeria aurantiellina]